MSRVNDFKKSKKRKMLDIKDYSGIIDIFKAYYIRDTLEYFYVGWEWKYNHNCDKYYEIPVFAVSFLPEYFKQGVDTKYCSQYLPHTPQGYSLETVLAQLSGYKFRFKSLRVPCVQQAHVSETVDLLSNLFIEKRVVSFRFGAELRITGNVNRHLTLEIVTVKGDILKYDCGLLKHFCQGVFRQRILEAI